MTNSTKNGPSRTKLPVELRQQTNLHNLSDLESYARYFTGDKPQDETELAAQALKVHVDSQKGATTFLNQGSVRLHAEEKPT